MQFMPDYCGKRVNKHLSRLLAGTLIIIATTLMCIWPQIVWPQGGMTEQLRNLFSSAPPPLPRLIMVFVDISGSVAKDDWTIYESTYFSLVGPAEGRVGDKTALKPGPQGGPGDKLILGTITAATLTEFSPVAEGELRDTGQLRIDRDTNEATLKALHAAFAKVRAMKPARRTLILDALTLSQQLIERDKDRKPVIVLLSDMLEDSAIAGFDFEKKAPTALDTEAIVKRQRARGLLPDLHGAQVYVVGAKAANSAHAEAVKAFWVRYLQEASAVIEPGMYGRSVINFAEAWRQKR